MTPAAVATPSAAPVRARSARPSFDDILDALRGRGLSCEEAGALLGLFTQLTVLTDRFEKTGNALMVFADAEGFEDAWESPDMDYIAAVCLSRSDSRHDSLDRIMPDLAIAAPGSAHELLERGLLRRGDKFVHDRIGHCVIAVKRG